MGKLMIFVVAVVAGSLGAIMASNFFDETTGRPANAESGSRSAPAGSGPPIWGDLNCDGDIDGLDGIGAFRSFASLEQLPQNEPCLDIGSLATDETDSARFQLHFVNEVIGHIVYCGAVHANAHPYTLDVTTSNPPALSNPQDPNSPPEPGHDGAGWLIVTMQDGIETQFNVPTNSSFAFDLHPEGTEGVDQLIQISSPARGDEAGGGAAFTGFASVQAAAGAIDPFTGDGRDDNFCVTIGMSGELPAEFVQCDISTTLPVPNGWVLDDVGSDGGVLRGSMEADSPCTVANVESGSRVASAGSGPPVMGDNDCDGDVDGLDGLAAFRSLASLEQLPQNEPCLDIGSATGSLTDTEQFVILYVGHQTGHIVYCGAVHANDHPYKIDVTASNEPERTNPENPDSPPKPGHDGAGWLIVGGQNGLETQFNVPHNSSFAFDLHPEGTAGVDELIQIMSPPKGNESGGGSSFAGFASVQAAAGAVDPFTGDNVDDNFCVTIGIEGEVPAEFVEGEITTTLPVPNDWVLDDIGSDGGVLRGVPH